MFNKKLKCLLIFCTVSLVSTVSACDDAPTATTADAGTNNDFTDTTNQGDSDPKTPDDTDLPTDTHPPKDTGFPKDTDPIPTDTDPSEDTGEPDTRKLLTLTTLRAFPTAEGAGAGATGGRGGKVIYVTNRADRGPGSFHQALTTPGPRTIVFAVGGRFQIENMIYMSKNGDFTFAGQTANDLGGVHFTSEGTAKDNRLYISQSQNMIFRYLDTKHQWQWFIEKGDDGRRASFTTTECYNVIIDHSSSGWGSYSFSFAKHNDEADAIGKYTLQRSLSHESVRGHNVASVTGQAYSFANTFPPEQQLAVWNKIEDLDFHHNAYIGMTHRFPNTEGWENGRFRVINNYIYGWGSRLNNMSGNARNDIIANVYEKAQHNSAMQLTRMHVINFASNIKHNPPELVPNVHIKDNLVLHKDGSVFAPATDDNWNMMSHWSTSKYGNENTMLDRKHQRNTPIPDGPHPIKIHAANTVKDNVLSNVGANVRFNPDGTTYYVDPIDQMYINWARNHEGPTRTSTVTGDGGLGDPARFVYPTYVSNSRDLDTWDSDRDGMPDEWEIRHGLDPSNPDDRNNTKLDWEFDRYRVRNDAGYTNLEIYLADIAGDFHTLANE